MSEFGGSFSAEHGIGISKLQSMKRHENVISLEVMQAIKASLDPHNIMNPGKVLPSSDLALLSHKPIKILSQFAQEFLGQNYARKAGQLYRV